jgi:hypothetical protein
MSTTPNPRQALITALYLEFIHNTRNKVPDERVASLLGEQLRQHDAIQEILQHSNDVARTEASNGGF